jgi:hypothetical protein
MATETDDLVENGWVRTERGGGEARWMVKKGDTWLRRERLAMKGDGWL